MYDSVSVRNGADRQVIARTLNAESLIVSDSLKSGGVAAGDDVRAAIGYAAVATGLSCAGVSRVAMENVSDGHPVVLLLLDLRWIRRAKVRRNSTLTKDITACVQRTLVQISPSRHIRRGLSAIDLGAADRIWYNGWERWSSRAEANLHPKKDVATALPSPGVAVAILNVLYGHAVGIRDGLAVVS